MSERVSEHVARADRSPIVPPTGWSAPLVTLVAVAMSFLGLLALAAGLAADRLAETWRADLEGAATVQVVATPDQRETRIEQALAVLRTTPGIEATRVVPDAELEAMLAPWLGEAADIEALPAPRLIEVEIENGGPDPERLQARLDQSAPGARYDNHDAWRAPLARAADRLRLLAWGATLLIAGAAAGTVALAVRATLAANTEVVRIVRLIGGEDRYIAGAFVRRLTLRGLAGGLIGSSLAGAALMALPDAARQTGVDLDLAPGPMGWLALVVGVALASAAIAWATALVSVRLTLSRIR